LLSVSDVKRVSKGLSALEDGFQLGNCGSRDKIQLIQKYDVGAGDLSAVKLSQ
jgi:hypothetical protein